MVLQLGLDERRELAHLFDLQIKGESRLRSQVTDREQLLLSCAYDRAPLTHSPVPGDTQDHMGSQAKTQSFTGSESIKDKKASICLGTPVLQGKATLFRILLKIT